MHPDNLPGYVPVSFSFFVLTLSLFFGNSDALAINKCRQNGNTTYTDQPCPDGSVSLPYDNQVAPAGDPEAAHQRYLADQQQLILIQQENAEQDKLRRRDAGVAAQKYKLAKAKEYRCKKLDAKRKAARQLQSETRHGMNPKKTGRAQQRVRQTEDDYEAVCSSGQ